MKTTHSFSRTWARRSRIARVAAFVCGLLGAFTSGAQSPVAGVKLSALPRQASYLIGEPVVLTLVISNGGNTVFHCQPLAQEYGYVQISVGAGEGAREEFGLARVKDPTKPPAAVSPGETYAEEQNIHFNFKGQKLAFPKAGSFVVRVEYRSWAAESGAPLSSEAVVRVVEPGKGEADGSELFSGKDVGSFIADGSREQAVARLLENLAGESSQTVFGRYAAFYAGRHALREYDDKPADPAAAERLLMLCDRPGFQMRMPALLRLAEACGAQGRPQEAVGYLDRVLAESTPLRGQAVLLKQRFAQAAARGVPAVPKAAPVTDEQRATAAARVNAYFAAYVRSDLDACLAMLDASFQMRDVPGKDRMAAQLRKEFAKAGRLRDSLPGTQITSLKVAEGGLELEALVSFANQQGKAITSQRVRLHLVNRGGNWLIDKWLP